MSSKFLIVLGLLLAGVLFVSSEVTAETSKNEKKLDNEGGANQVDESKQGARCRHGCCGSGPYGCYRCCRRPDEATEVTAAEDEVQEEMTQVDESKQGGRCRYGCCRWGRFGCLRCCQRPNEAIEDEVQEEMSQVDESKQVRRCRYGCCMRGRFGCVRCCRRPNEATEAVQEEMTQVDESKQVRCRYGCCSWGRFGCVRCCRRPNEAMVDEAANEKTSEVEEEKAFGGIGKCRHGCCGGYGKFGQCRKCCYPKEAQGTAKTEDKSEAKPEN